MESFSQEIKAKDLLADYTGANNYIIGLRDGMLKTKTFTLTHSQSEYITKNHQEKPKVVRMWMEIDDYLAKNICLQSFYKNHLKLYGLRNY